MTAVILLIVLLIIAGIFSLQNAIPVTVTFLLWKFEASQAIIVLLSILGGILIGAILTLFIRFKRTLGKTTRDRDT
jgi:putative membrane protein